MQAQAVDHPGVYSWHDLDQAGRMFPLDPVLRETSAHVALDLDLAKCMAVPTFIRVLSASPFDQKWQRGLRNATAKSGPNNC